MHVVFTKDKETKNTIRFMEVPPSGLSDPKIGMLYIPKATLSGLKWSEDKTLVVDIKVTSGSQS